MDSSANNNTAAATGKRKAGDINTETTGVNGGATTFVRGSLQPPYAPQLAAVAASSSPKKGAANKKKSKPTDSAKAQARLEANRKAARESRRRKKVLVEELQRSVRLFCLFVCTFVHVGTDGGDCLNGLWACMPLVSPLYPFQIIINIIDGPSHMMCVSFSNLSPLQVIFFSRANGQLKQKNEELERMFIQAQAQIAARNDTTAAASEGGQEVQEAHQGGELKTEDGGSVKTADEVNDTADVKEDGNSADVPQGDTLLTTAAGGDQEQTTTDAQPQQQQQQEMSNIPFPGMVQQPIPFTAVPGAPAPAMDPNTMMYMMMMSGNPLANTMMAANPMMALQMFNQLNAATAGAMAGGVQQQQAQVPATTQGANAPAAAANTTAAAPTAFPAMPVGVGNVVMPTPGGAFNPFGGFPAAAAVGTTNPEAATTAAATAAEGEPPSAAADVTEDVNV